MVMRSISTHIPSLWIQWHPHCCYLNLGHHLKISTKQHVVHLCSHTPNSPQSPKRKCSTLQRYQGPRRILCLVQSQLDPLISQMCACSVARKARIPQSS